MNAEEKAKSYFQTDPLLYADTSEILARGNAEIITADECGVLLYERKAGTYLLCAEEYTGAVALLENVEREKIYAGSGFIVAHGEKARAAVKDTFPVGSETACYQVVYTSKTPLPLSGALAFRHAERAEIERIKRDYDREPPESIEQLAKEKKLWCGFDSEGAFVGFIGSHPEGSMGLLLIFPEHRRKGYGEELEKMLVNAYLAEGRLPYGHVVVGNEVSMRLQEKLGYEVADGKIYWLKIAHNQ